MATSLIGLEACSGAHFLGRELRKQGHDVRLIAAQFVKPLVKSNKNDFVDAEAIAREQGNVYAREYKGADPAFVLMHGFPDNLHIWDDLIPYLTASGRRVVTFDFLGFGASDKPAGASYSFLQQLADLEA